jgi:hypothetical protein
VKSLKLEDTGKWEGGKRTHPTEATRRRVKVAREGCREENMRKDGKGLESLKLEDTKSGMGGNEHIPPRQPDGASRLLVKGAVKMTEDADSAKRGVNKEIMEGRWCGGGCGGNLTQEEGQHTIQPGAHTLKLYSM